MDMKPRRSHLSVPGHIEKMHLKASLSAADVIILDLEDSVPVEAKEKARKQVADSIRSIDWGKKTLTLRINSLDTPFAYRDLLEICESSGNFIDSVVIPKVDYPGDVHFVSRMLDGIEMAMGFDNTIGIEASIESAIGMSLAVEIASSSKRLISLVFGIADYSSSIGARLVSISGHGEREEDIYPGHRWNFELSRMVMAAKANGLLAIDAPYGNFKDIEGLRRSSLMVTSLGCDGKWAIHPDQIEEINRIFSPSSEEIDRAQRILAAAREGAQNGRGAVAIDGRMIDQATIRLAKKLYEQAEYLKMI